PRSGCPGVAATGERVAITALLWEVKTAASPTRFNGCFPTWPPKWSKAAIATSGPMPEGSPIVIRIGCPPPLADIFYDPLSADEGIGLALIAHLDIGVALQVAQIAPRQGGDLALEQLVFHLLASGHHIGG